MNLDLSSTTRAISQNTATVDVKINPIGSPKEGYQIYLTDSGVSTSISRGRSTCGVKMKLYNKFPGYDLDKLVKLARYTRGTGKMKHIIVYWDRINKEFHSGIIKFRNRGYCNQDLWGAHEKCSDEWEIISNLIDYVFSLTGYKTLIDYQVETMNTNNIKPSKGANVIDEWFDNISDECIPNEKIVYKTQTEKVYDIELIESLNKKDSKIILQEIEIQAMSSKLMEKDITIKNQDSRIKELELLLLSYSNDTEDELDIEDIEIEPCDFSKDY